MALQNGVAPPKSVSGVHFDAAGNEVDQFGRITKTKAQVDAETAAAVANGTQPGVLDRTADAVAPIADTLVAPETGVLAGANDVTQGNYGQTVGDLAYGATGGIVGNSNGPAQGIINPRSAGDAVKAFQAAGGALVGGIGSALAPNVSDTSGLNAITGKALGTQDALTGRIQTLEANPTRAPQSDLVQLDQTNIDPLRQRQGVALDQLQAAAEGRAPSAAEILGRDQANRASAQAYGNAAALQGGNSSGGALRQALDAQTQIQGDANTQLVAARAKEMSDARNQLVQGLGAARGQESTDATTNANLGQNKNLANTQAAVTTHGQDVSQEGDLISGQNTALATAAGAAKAKVDADTANAASANALKGAEIGGAASAIPKLISDRRAKTNVHSADLVQLAEDAPGYTFDYKDAKDGPGRRVGVMAQDVARSRMGKDMVRMGDDDELVLDGPNAVGAALAMSAEALRKAEAARKRR